MTDEAARDDRFARQQRKATQGGHRQQFKRPAGAICLVCQSSDMSLIGEGEAAMLCERHRTEYEERNNKK